MAEVYSKEDLAKLFKVRQESIFLALLIDATYWMRRSELVGLRWSVIDFGRGTIIIKSSAVYTKVDGKYQTVVKDKLKRNSSYRTVPLTAEVGAFLQVERERQRRNRKKGGKAYSKAYLDFVFVDLCSHSQS